MTLGDNIRRIRKEVGLTLKQLGDLAGVNRGNLSRIENSSPEARLEVSTLDRVAEGLGVPLHTLFIDDDGCPVALRASPHRTDHDWNAAWRQRGKSAKEVATAAKRAAAVARRELGLPPLARGDEATFWRVFSEYLLAALHAELRRDVGVEAEPAAVDEHTGTLGEH